MMRLFGIKGDPGRSIPELEEIIAKGEYKDDDYIHKRFIILVKHYDYMSRQNSDQYAVFQVILIILYALTTFTVGLEAIVVTATFLKVLALLFTILVAILGSYLTTFNVQAKWGAYRTIRESLIAEFYKYYIGVEPYSPSGDRTNESRKFAANVEKLIEDANKSWGGLNSAERKQG